MTRRSWQCSWEHANGSRCTRVGVGQPPYCRDHFHQLYYADGAADEINDDLIESFLGHPIVADLFGRFASGLASELPFDLPRPVQPPRRQGGAYYAEWPPRPDNPFAGAPPPRNNPGPTPRQPPPPPAPSAEDPRVVLGFGPTEALDVRKIKARQRALAAVLHPDHGGDNDAMRRINTATAALLSQLS